MKKITALVLILTFLFNTLGCHMLLIFQKYQVRREMILRIKGSLSNDALTLIKITPKNKLDLHWKDAHEFMYQDFMYDVVKTETINKQTVVYYCITDSLEMKLLAELENLIKKNKSTKSSKTNFGNSFVKVIPKIEDEFITNFNLLSLADNKTSSQYLNLYDSQQLDIASPPPKLG